MFCIESHGTQQTSIGLNVTSTGTQEKNTGVIAKEHRNPRKSMGFCEKVIGTNEKVVVLM